MKENRFRPNFFVLIAISVLALLTMFYYARFNVFENILMEVNEVDLTNLWETSATSSEGLNDLTEATAVSLRDLHESLDNPLLCDDHGEAIKLLMLINSAPTNQAARSSM